MSSDTMDICDGCGDEINPEYGTAVCPECGKRKCVAQCIPSGNHTACVDCEEKA